MISVCFITKNEEKWLGGCIQHLKEIVSEFIVLDTGSTDSTLDIARQAGAKVFSASWPGSFADARNMSLDHATQDWILRIDPDERISKAHQQEILELTKSNEFEAFEFTTRGYTNSIQSIEDPGYLGCRGEYPDYEEGFVGFTKVSYIRLFRRLPQIRYIGSIHEDVKSQLPDLNKTGNPLCLRHDLIVHHYGWDPKAMASKGKSSLYESMMLKEIERQPGQWHLFVELAMIYLKENNFQRAEEIFERASKIQMPDESKSEILSNWGLCLLKRKKYSEATTCLLDSLRLNPKLPMGWLNLGSLMLEQKKFPEALDALKKSIGLDSQVPLSWRLLGQVAATLGDISLAERGFQKSLELAPHYEDAHLDLAILYNHCGQKSRAISLVENCLLKNPHSAAAKSLQNQLNPSLIG